LKLPEAWQLEAVAQDAEMIGATSFEKDFAAPLQSVLVVLLVLVLFELVVMLLPDLLHAIKRRIAAVAAIIVFFINDV
jgi:hypothetical protein